MRKITLNGNFSLATDENTGAKSILSTDDNNCIATVTNNKITFTQNELLEILLDGDELNIRIQNEVENEA